MKERPLKHSDSFWGDLANAIALRPVYRRPVEAPQATKAVTLQSTKESVASTAQQKAEEKARTAVQHEAQEETTTAETTAPLYRYLQEEQRKAFAPTAESERMVDAASLIQDLTEQELRTITTDALNNYQLRQAEQRALKALDGTEFVSVSGINFPQEFLDRLRGRNTAERVAVHGSPPNDEQSEATDVVDDEQVPLSTNEATEALPEATGSSSPAQPSKATGKRTIPNGSSGIRRVGRVQRILKPKLKASQLKGMGFSQQEATVLAGLFRGRRINSIAARLSTRPANVLHVVKQLMAKFEAATLNSLLQTVWSLHRDNKHLPLIQAAAVKALLSDEPPRGETRALGGLVVVNSGTVIERPKGINIPEGHPDHPSNDPDSVGVKWKEWEKEKGKRTPAHSKATPSPKKPE